jgi:hypothetical protein
VYISSAVCAVVAVFCFIALSVCSVYFADPALSSHGLKQQPLLRQEGCDNKFSRIFGPGKEN